jgi:hypothetical protein
MPLFINAQQSNSSIYTIEKSRDFTSFFASLQWEYPNSLKEILPTQPPKLVINWQNHLIKLKDNQARYKSIVLPEKEVLASCALMLVLFDKESDSEFYQKKTTYIQLLQERLNSAENQYLKQCLNYLEEQRNTLQMITLWQTYFHYTTNGHQALYVAEKLLANTEKATDLAVEVQEDLIATIYYLIGAIYADRGEWTNKRKYYTLCYELRKKRGDDLCYSMNRVLKNTSPGLEQRKVLFKDLLNSIEQYGSRKDKKIFEESMDYLFQQKEYQSTLEFFEKGTLRHPAFLDLEDLSYGIRCPYFYLGLEALSNGSTFDDPTQDSVAMHWFYKWLNVLDTLAPQNTALTSDHIKLEGQYYLNYTDHACTRIVDYLLYYGNSELAKDFFDTHQKDLYFTPNTNPNLIYNFNFFYYKFIQHHTVALNDSLVFHHLKDYLDLSYDVIKGEEKAKIESANGEIERGRECIAWLGQNTATTASYLQYLEYWMLRAKQLNYRSEEILAHRYYCAELRKDQQYVKALEFALKLKHLTKSKTNSSIEEYAWSVREYFVENVINHHEINSKERQEAILVIKKRPYRKDRKWYRRALKQLQKQAPFRGY